MLMLFKLSNVNSRCDFCLFPLCSEKCLNGAEHARLCPYLENVGENVKHNEASSSYDVRKILVIRHGSSSSSCSNLNWCSNPGIKWVEPSSRSHFIRRRGNIVQVGRAASSKLLPHPLMKLELLDQVVEPNTRVCSIPRLGSKKGSKPAHAYS